MILHGGTIEQAGEGVRLNRRLQVTSLCEPGGVDGTEATQAYGKGNDVKGEAAQRPPGLGSRKGELHCRQRQEQRHQVPLAQAPVVLEYLRADDRDGGVVEQEEIAIDVLEAIKEDHAESRPHNRPFPINRETIRDRQVLAK